MTQSIALSHLEQAEFFHGINQAQREALLADCQFQTLAKRTEILRQDENATACFVILHGLVEVSHLDSEGQTMIIHLAGPGEVVGEVEIFAERACVASCFAQPGTQVLACTAEAILRHMPAELLVRNYASIQVDRLARDIRQRLLGQYYSVDARICQYLAQLTAKGGPETQVSQAYLASLAGCSRQTVNRKLGALKRAGIIELGRGTITVLDRARLLAQDPD